VAVIFLKKLGFTKKKHHIRHFDFVSGRNEF